MFSSDGHELGEFVTAALTGTQDVFFTAGRRRFRILAIVDVDKPDSPHKEFFEVEPMEGYNFAPI